MNAGDSVGRPGWDGPGDGGTAGPGPGGPPAEGAGDGDRPGVLAEGPAAAAEEESSRRESWCDKVTDCSDCDCDLPCDLPCDCDLLLRLSTLLSVAAALVPARAGRSPVLALLRFYRRRLTRFTPSCPSTPSCSSYALDAVQTLGARRGLAAAGRRVRDCGRPPG
jgi:membrane protein insertion efficiency factor YidD